MKYFILFISVPILIHTQDMVDYYPHHNGDLWQYLDSDFQTLDYWTKTLISDSIDSSGNIHLLFRIEYLGYSGYRIEHEMIDTLSQVWKIEGNTSRDSILWFKMNADSGEWWLNYPFYPRDIYSKIIDIGSIFLFGEQRKFKTKMTFISDNPDSNILEMGHTTFVEGLGWYHSWYESGPDNSTSLTGAIIDGNQFGNIVSLQDQITQLGDNKIQLFNIFPNPFNNSTSITISVIDNEYLNISIFNLHGRKIRELKNTYVKPGITKLYWDGRDKDGRLSPSGIYFVHVQTNKINQCKKVMFVK